MKTFYCWFEDQMDIGGLIPLFGKPPKKSKPTRQISRYYKEMPHEEWLELFWCSLIIS